MKLQTQFKVPKILKLKDLDYVNKVEFFRRNFK